MHKSRKPEFRFKLNGIIIPELRIERALVDGRRIGRLQIAAFDSQIGWIVVDDNSHLPDRALSRFVFEYRCESDWRMVDPVLKRSDPTKGWHRVSPRRLMKVLNEAGLIEVDIREIEE